MKCFISNLRSLSKYAIPLALTSLCFSQMTLATPITGWLNDWGKTEFNGNQVPVSTIVEPIDYNTDHPIIGNNTESNAQGAFLSAQIPEITLSVGDSLSFSGSVILKGGVFGTDEYRVGIWNDNGQFEARNPKGWLDGWVYIMDLGIWEAVTNGRVFLSVAQTGAEGDAINLQAQESAAVGAINPDSTDPIEFNFTITRNTATSINIEARSKALGGTGNFAEVYSKNDIATTNFTFNTVSWLGGQNSQLDQASFSNMAYTYTPATTPITNWVNDWGITEFQGNQVPVSTIVEPIDFDTNHPTLGNNTENNAQGAFLSAQIPEITLRVGEQLTFSGKVTLTGGVFGTDEYRVGFWNDNGQFKTRNPKGWLDGWIYIMDLGMWEAVTNGRVFLSVAQTGTEGDAIDLQAQESAAVGAINLDSTDPIEFSFTITRNTATTINIEGKAKALGAGTFAEVYSKNDITTTNFTFNTVSWLSGQNSQLDQAVFSDMGYSYSRVLTMPNDCIATFSPEQERLIIPCVDTGAGKYYVELQQQPGKLSFDLDTAKQIP